MAKDSKETTTIARQGEVLPVPSEEKPRWLQALDGSNSRAGFENVEQADQYTPRLGLCQNNSPQRQKESPNYIEGLEEGDFFHSVRGLSYGSGPLLFTPIFMFKTAVNTDEDGKLICRSEDAKSCPKYGTCRCNDWVDDKPPVCTKVYNVPIVLYNDQDYEEGLIMTFKSTEIATFKDFISKMKMTGAPMYGHAWKLSSIGKSKDKLRWYGYKLEPAGWTPDNIAMKCEGLYTKLKQLHTQGKLNVDITGLDAEEPTIVEHGGPAI